MKKLNIILVIIAVVNIIFAFSLFLKEGIIIYVNDSNKEIVQNALKGEIGNIETVNKIVLGRGWHSGELTIYHFLEKTDTVLITEGMFKAGELEDYIRQNGYNLDNLAFILLGSSATIILYIIIYKRIVLEKD